MPNEGGDYCPFGLTFNTYQRENSIPNFYQYNGKELQDELNLGWSDYGARMYMADIGRWGVIEVGKPTKVEGEDGKGEAQQGISGLSIEFGPDYSDPSSLGVAIRLSFKNPNDQFSSYGWIQTVRTNSNHNFPGGPPLRDNEPFNDSPGDNTPYYPIADYNREGFNTIMSDHPGRDRNSAYVIWRAEVTIGGIRDGVFVPLGTMTYGFDIIDGKLDVYYPQVAQPTPWHIDSFTNKSKW